MYLKNKANFLLHSDFTNAITNFLKLTDFKQQKCVRLQIWRPKLQHKGIVRATLPLKTIAENPFSPLLASGSSRYSSWLCSFTPVSTSVLVWPAPFVFSPSLPLHRYSLNTDTDTHFLTLPSPITFILVLFTAVYRFSILFCQSGVHYGYFLLIYLPVHFISIQLCLLCY